MAYQSKHFDQAWKSAIIWSWYKADRWIHERKCRVLKIGSPKDHWISRTKFRFSILGLKICLSSSTAETEISCFLGQLWTPLQFFSLPQLLEMKWMEFYALHTNCLLLDLGLKFNNALGKKMETNWVQFNRRRSLDLNFHLILVFFRYCQIQLEEQFIQIHRILEYEDII